MASENKKAKSGKFSIETFVRSEEALLAALLQCAVKGRAETVAGELLSRFKTLENVLSADLKVLCNIPGMNANSALLLKLIDYYCNQRIESKASEKKEPTKEPQIKKKVKQKPVAESGIQALEAPPRPETIQKPAPTEPEAKAKPAPPRSEAKAKPSPSETKKKPAASVTSPVPETLLKPEVSLDSEAVKSSQAPVPAPEATETFQAPVTFSVPEAVHFEIADAIPAYLKQRDEEELQYEDGAPRRKVTMFSKAILKEGIALLPSFPDTESVPEINEYLRNNLHFSAETTRKRYAGYITGRIFYKGIADKALRHFAKKFQGRQELREVCFFRFCKAEPLVIDVINDLFLPAIGTAKLERENLRAYLVKRFGNTNYAQGCGQAIVEAMTSGGIAKADKKAVYFEFRDVLLPSFAFIIHDEFPEFGMYDISRIESGRNLKVMLWNPDRILPALYELRNRNILSKVSEIDSVRQFTLKMRLEEIVDKV